MDQTTAEALLQELQASPQDFLFNEPRFHRTELLDLLLAESRDAQLVDPAESANLAEMAICIALRIQSDPAVARSALLRAYSLSANAYRLAKLPELAEAALSGFVEILDPIASYDVSHRADYCRTLSLLRWEQGHLDEALSLLRQAWRLFGTVGETTEQTACALLLGLLHDEMGLPEKVFASVSPHLGDFSGPSCPPWLISRAMLTFAAAATETRLLALIALDEGVRFHSYVADAKEQLRLFALEGRARARLGFFDEAEQIVEAVRRQHLAAERMIDLTLSSLDLLALRIAAGRPRGIDKLRSDIEGLGSRALTSVEWAAAALDRFVSSVSGGDHPWISLRLAATWYLQIHRFAGYQPSLLPFA